MLEVTPGGETTVIRCNIVLSPTARASPLRLDKAVTFTFGLVATPVREVPVGDAFWFRFGDPVGEPPPMEYFRYPHILSRSSLWSRSLALW